MRKIGIALSVVILLATAIFVGSGQTRSAASKGQRTTLTPAESRFVVQATQGGMAEVKLGQLAQQNGSSEAVKQFGQRMEQDHSAANSKLADVASKKGLTLPTTISTKDQAEYDRLAKMHGAAFDRAYMAMMVKDHQKDVADFQRESRMARDPELKHWISGTLPTLQDHLHMATSDNQKVSRR